MRDYWSIILIILLSPLLLYAVWFILPTHDDWAATTTPDFTPFFTKEHFFFYGYHWRPFDTWIGYLVGRNPQLLFPAINHLLVVLGHFLSVVALFKVLIVLGFNKKTINVSTLFFFIIPATMATVTAIDSQNQVYALTTDLIAFLFYVKNSKNKYIFWPILIFLATLFKENGLMWALICPVLAYGFDLIDKKTLKKDLLVGLGIMIAYALIIAIQPKDITIHPEYEPGVLKIIKNIVKFLFTSFITVDYIYLLHQPSRKLLLAIVSFLFALPFLYLVFIRQWHLFSHKKMWCTAICLLIAVAPHLLTTFSMMHTYAGLAFITIMIAYSINTYKEQQKTLILSFVLFLIVSVAIDIHLIDSSIKSGRIGNQMAREAIQKTGKPMKSVYLIIIEDDYPKLSSFCVIPNEAFGWGIAAKYETNYQWPEVIKDTTIERSADAFRKATNLGLETLNKQQYDCIWIVDHEHIDVIKR
jgi:hypothetical protein